MRLGLSLAFCLIFSAQSAADDLHRCLDLAAQRQSVVLAKDCPKLWRELQNSGLPAAFEPPLDGKVTPAQLQFLSHSRQLARSPDAIRQDGLEQLLAGILQPEPADLEKAWWNTLMAWLDKLKSGDYETQYRWVLDLLTAITPSGDTIAAILYGAIVLMVLVSLWLIVREYFYAGMFAGLPGARRHSERNRSFPAQAHDSSLALPEIGALPPRRQIAALLNNVVAALIARGIAPENATLTHRQLERHIARHAPQTEAEFGGLLRLAEPVLFGKRGANEETLQACWRQARLLLGAPAR